MKLKNTFFTIIVAGLTIITASSCSDYLDVSKEMNQNLTLDKVFENPNYTRDWYGNIYLCISEFSETGSETNAFKNPWSNMCGEISSQMMPNKDAMTAGYTAGSSTFHRWATLYQYIRQAMIFIDRANDEGVGSDSNQITPTEIARMKDEARFLMAYCYFSIFELYGPCPIVTQIDDAAYPQVFSYQRASVDEMVEYIDGLLKGVIDGDNLPASVITGKTNGVGSTFNLNEIVRPTKITAMALRAKLWVYAASPLFNGGWDKAMQLKDKDGKQIFPAKDPNKWVIAKQHLEELLSAAQEAGHTLYEVQSNGTNLPDQSIYQLFQVYNQEILWCSTNNSYSDQNKMEKRTNPRDVNSCYGTIGPSQESVDMFFTQNGLPISEDPSYHENALVQVTNPAINGTGGTRADKNVFNMYANREPRFYADVIYQGKSWYDVYQNKSGNANYFVDFSIHGGAGPDSRDNPLVGYLLGKFKNRTINHASGDTQSYKRVSTIYRLAEFYLFYAEVLNEIDPSDPRIIEYLDYVRDRAGVPTYQKLAEEGIKDIRGSYAKQWDAIQRERFVELFCEGQRYFDIRRWMVCGPGQVADQTRFSGMNEYGTTDVAIGTMGSYYNRTVIENRIWDDKMYLYPIHQNVIQLSKGEIIQNPGW
ncbi:RagB/SusD family nutrient uptake outer membrane protein [uncultured Bacteroides sp.]|uniref:RagB/SusD family nutrient uptake outer membrane protein n=1 Tax=uncultured Bacteroides sp. TaxID=162156 RepID=UPI002AA8B7D1|nr:RagB/SusD family nutrient uptake outer membrane protein [uncultured Bacteroides sp.]